MEHDALGLTLSSGTEVLVAPTGVFVMRGAALTEKDLREVVIGLMGGVNYLQDRLVEARAQVRQLERGRR
jgi:hypothetical protein